MTVNSKETGIVHIPRENGKIRLYIESGPEDKLSYDDSGRLDLTNFNADVFLEVNPATS